MRGQGQEPARMRIRTVKPSFWKSETLASVPKEHRLLAIALLNYADDEGYFLANEALVRGECFPFDEDSTSIRGGLAELSRIGYLVLGKTSEGQRIGLVLNFLEHQKIDKPSPSKLKTKTITWDDGADHSPNPPRSVGDRYAADREEEREKEREGAESPTVAAIPLNDGSEFIVTEADVTKWEPVYPAVNIRHTLLRIREWCIAHPNKRKTRRGARGFITTWLGRDQDKGGSKVVPIKPRDEFAGVR